MEALQEAQVHSKGTKDQNIYIFYGLHFSKFKKGDSVKRSRKNIAIRLLESLNTWKGNFNRSDDFSIKEDIQDIMQWNRNILVKNYFNELIDVIGKEKIEKYLEENKL